MKIFSIYHANEVRDAKGKPVGIRGAFGFEATRFPEDYTHVADVEAEHIDDVYALTQNRDRPWTEQRTIHPRVLTPCRSTSVMDMILDDGRRAWVVAPVGLERVHLDQEGRGIVAPQY